jgi:hypothetical protein
VLDITSDTLPAVDLIFCRDCLVHLPLFDIHAALHNFRQSGATWLLTTTFTRRSHNPDILPGSWRPINLQAPPFNLPAPTRLIDELCTERPGGEDFSDKHMGLWKLR